MKRRITVAVIALLSAQVAAQKKYPQTNNSVKPTTAQTRWNSAEKRDNLLAKSLVKNLEFRNIGPTSVSGRITDVEVNPENPEEFYAAYASGGLWYTDNAGSTFTPVFDHQAVMTIGDIAVDWKSGTVWVGTGESNSSRSSYAGMGIYKSSDKGKTWQNTGLRDSHHIGRIIINPNNANEVWVAAVGHLYSTNTERGVFKTTDGGTTWSKVLYLDPETGAIDLQLNPKNPNELYAAMWNRTRKAWNFNGNGATSGIYKTTDGGQKWQLISGEASGFPTGAGNGRIGLAVYPQNPEILYAIIDNWDKRPASEGDVTTKKTLDAARIKNISREEFMDLDENELNQYLTDAGFPEQYTAKKLKQLIQQNKIRIQDVYNYTHNGNNDLFENQIHGAEVYRSDNGGTTWRKTHTKDLDGLFYTYGYYFAQIWVSPKNPDKLYVGGVPIVRSDDGGKTFKDINADNVHSDHHALWINPKNDKIIINGNDGGLNMSYDSGRSWRKLNPIPVSQLYDVDYDLAKPYNVYAGMQDNGVWYGPSTNKFNSQDGMFYGGDNFKYLMGGDGMQTRVDWRDNETLYTGFQFGNYFRINKKTGERKFLEMPREIGEPALRFNWEAPFNISRHGQDILYFGGQYVFRSMDKGDTWTKISPDLTRNLPQGNVPFSTLTTIEESPMRFGLLYAGTDDGLIHVSKDGGYTWQKIMDRPGLWVSQIVPSKYSENRVYATLTGYREDHFSPYVYLSEDFGKTWRLIGNDLPAEPVNVIREDPANQDLLYVGTDNGVYLSLDRGKSFMSANNRWLPNVAVHDLKIHHTENELIVGTHGRSVYIADVKPLQQLTPENLAKNLIIFSLNDIKFNKNWGKSTSNFTNIKEPEYLIQFYSKNEGVATLNIYDVKGTLLNTLKQQADAGLNSFRYNYQIDAKNASAIKSRKADSGNYYLTPGKYTLEICINGTCEKKDVEIKENKPRSRRDVPQGETTPGEMRQWRREVGFQKTL